MRISLLIWSSESYGRPPGEDKALLSTLAKDGHGVALASVRGFCDHGRQPCAQLAASTTAAATRSQSLRPLRRLLLLTFAGLYNINLAYDIYNAR